MEISEQLYKVNPLSKNNIWADANRDSHVTKLKGGEDDLPTNPKKVCAGKYKTKTAVSLSKKTTGIEEKNFCCMVLDTSLRSVKCL